MVELDDGVTLQISDAVIDLLEGMQDKNEAPIFSKVNLGKIKSLTAHKGVVAEVYVNDEDRFQYMLGREEHKNRDVEIIIGIFVKGVDGKPERLRLSIKDLIITLIEKNGTLGGLTMFSQIKNVVNGRRPEGNLNNPTLFGASMIYVKYNLHNP